MTKLIKMFVPVFLCILIIFAYVTPFVETSENISDSVFRLHILANSDSDEDQALKLKVRDKILEAGQDLFMNCTSLDDVINTCNENIDFFKSTAKSCIDQNGYNYDVHVYVDREYFNTREYESITLPGGVYNALKIEIGSAEGHNWWCVMFPAICLPAVSDDEIHNILDDEEIELINSNQKYDVRFKIVEIYEKLQYSLNNK